MSEDTQCKFAQQFSAHFHSSHMLPLPLWPGIWKSQVRLAALIKQQHQDSPKWKENVQEQRSKKTIHKCYMCVYIILKNSNTQYLQSLCSAVPAKEEKRLGHVSQEHDSFLLGAIRSKTIKCKSCFRFLLRLLLFHSGMGSASSQPKSVVLN